MITRTGRSWLLATLLFGLFVATVSGFSSHSSKNRFNSALHASRHGQPSGSRRSLFSGILSSSLLVLTPPLIASADTGAEVRGIDVNPFNGLMFQYRGSDFGGLEATSLDEPSISYQDFIAKLKSGDVESVEFLAPDGDAAYATLKAKDGGGKNNEAPVRIGEGYPVEQHDGWSSPAFAVRAVKNAGVPYKFTVPALRAFSTTT